MDLAWFCLTGTQNLLLQFPLRSVKLSTILLMSSSEAGTAILPPRL